MTSGGINSGGNNFNDFPKNQTKFRAIKTAEMLLGEEFPLSNSRVATYTLLRPLPFLSSSPPSP